MCTVFFRHNDTKTTNTMSNETKYQVWSSGGHSSVKINGREVFKTRDRDECPRVAAELNRLLGELRARDVSDEIKDANIAKLTEELAQVKADREIKVANLTEQLEASRSDARIKGENLELARGREVKLREALSLISTTLVDDGDIVRTAREALAANSPETQDGSANDKMRDAANG